MTRRAWLAVKAAVAAAIVAVLATTGRLSLDASRGVLSEPWICLGVIALQVVILMLGVLRWRLILGAIDRAPSYASLLAFNWIGQFFGTVAPSSIATDVTRFTYLRRSGQSSSVAATSLVVDRFCGIVGSSLITVILAAGLIMPAIHAPPARWAALTMLVALGVGCAIWRERRHPKVRNLAGRLHAGLSAAGSMKQVTAIGLAISAVALMLKVLSILLIVLGAAPPVPPVVEIFHIAPIGFLAESLPLAPGGFGTAHLAFEYLFGAAGIQGGADYFNVYFIARFVVSLFGAVLWLALGIGHSSRPARGMSSGNG
ncbi:MAG: lysylphosphatidylglycerol synthase transmembrane domain-containing protein [Gemmatimonadaceae bacterium]